MINKGGVDYAQFSNYLVSYFFFFLNAWFINQSLRSNEYFQEIMLNNDESYFSRDNMNGKVTNAISLT